MSKIEWTQKVWNPVTGCTKISAGCQNCYAEKFAKRLQKMPQSAEKYKNGFLPTFHPKEYHRPADNLKSTVYFVCSMGDLFHESLHKYEISKIIFEHILPVKQHFFIILTKRPDIMWEIIHNNQKDDWSNVCVGISVENNDATRRLAWFDHLDIPSLTKMVSIEPQLGPVSFKSLLYANVNWVINGAETGPRKRFFNINWALDLQSQCAEYHIPYFFKKDGHGQFPDGMRREFPEKLKNFLDKK